MITLVVNPTVFIQNPLQRYYKFCKYASVLVKKLDFFTVIQYVKDRRYIRQKAGRIIHAHRLWGLRRFVFVRYAALRWGGVKSVFVFCRRSSLGLMP